MRLVEAIKRKFEKAKVVDPNLGELEFRHGVWVGEVMFAGTGRRIRVSIAGDDQGPDEELIAFFSEIEQRYTELEESVGDDLYELASNADATAIREHLWQEFTLEGLRLPRPGTDGLEWELTYESTKYEDALFRVQVKDWNTCGVAIDT